jgi:DNA repair protein RecO (recombination protein O)
LARFELVLLRELGYSPALAACAGCGEPVSAHGLAFSPAAGGVLCSACQAKHRDAVPLSPAAWAALGELSENPESWRSPLTDEVRREIRQILNQYVTYLMGRPPRLLPYLGS